MRTYLLSITSLILACVVIGCSSPAPVAQKPKPKKPPVAAKKPPAVPTASLAELLKKPRVELAKVCDEILEELQQKARLRETNRGFVLSTDVRMPLAIPVFREATFSKAAGISLPPYLPEGATDSVIALHLARHGDIEAAQKLVDPVDKDAAGAIDILKSAQNYPLEWTRLVGLMLYSSQFSMMNGNVEGAKDLLSLHKQLVEMEGLPPYLQAALLSRGKSMLQITAASWRKGQHAELARQIDSYLEKWPKTEPPIVIRPRASREEVCRLFRAETTGHAVLAAHPLRGIDLLSLPLPSQDLDAVAGLFDAYDRLQEIFVSYSTVPPDTETAQQLGEVLDDWVPCEVDRKTATKCIYRLGEMNCDFMLTGRNPAVGAVARILPKETIPNGIEMPRDFGAIHLSGTFERNRSNTALNERAARLMLTKPAILEKISNPLPVLPLDHVTLVRTATEDTIEELIFQYARPAKGPATLAKIASPLLEKLGAPQVQTNSKEVHLRWEDSETRIVLTLPDLADKPVRVTAQDATNSRDRLARAQAWDLAERQQRIEANMPIVRLPRELSGFALGMTKAQIHDIAEKIPDGKYTNLTGGDKYLWSGQPVVPGEPMLRELFVLYDQEDKAKAIRARYDFGRLNPDSMIAPIAQKAGAAQPLVVANVWSELPAQPSPTMQQWHDDLTTLTCRRDEFTAEITLRDIPPASARSDPFPQLAYLPRGPMKSPLGQSRKDMLAAWGVREQVINGATLFTPPENSPYDAILVWFKHDKKNPKDDGAIRVVARHRAAGRKIADARQASLAVRQDWAKQMNEYGWPWRQDVLPGGLVQSWGHHDDFTRVRIFWQDSNQGKQVFTEWMPVK